MKKNVLKWLIEWFHDHEAISIENLEKNVDNNYFEQEFIDSFDFISLISDIEEEYGIAFDNEQFEDRSFSTLTGLSKIIEGMLENEV